MNLRKEYLAPVIRVSPVRSEVALLGVSLDPPTVDWQEAEEF